MFEVLRMWIEAMQIPVDPLFFKVQFPFRHYFCVRCLFAFLWPCLFVAFLFNITLNCSGTKRAYLCTPSSRLNIRIVTAASSCGTKRTLFTFHLCPPLRRSLLRRYERVCLQSHPACLQMCALNLNTDKHVPGCTQCPRQTFVNCQV
jgi:hypothetical protein